MSKLCPLKATAVQQHFQVERERADYDEVALEMAQHLFGECDQEDCQMWGRTPQGQVGCGLINWSFGPE